MKPAAMSRAALEQQCTGSINRRIYGCTSSRKRHLFVSDGRGASPSASTMVGWRVPALPPKRPSKLGPRGTAGQASQRHVEATLLASRSGRLTVLRSHQAGLCRRLASAARRPGAVAAPRPDRRRARAICYRLNVRRRELEDVSARVDRIRGVGQRSR